jgi:glycosyltransferase involved in cell wall biosynthesis
MPSFPIVSIGMPIYNASACICRALDSLLAQDFTDFELIICDNASTDDTYAICQAYAERDSRIRLYRNERNIGAQNNFTRVYELAAGQYFMWAAHDDWWEPGFIRACLAGLQARPDAALCFTESYYHYENTGATRLEHYPADISSAEAWQRCYQLLKTPAVNTPVYGLYRRETIRPGLPFQAIEASDTVFLLHMAQQGPFIRVDQPLHHYTVARRGGRIRVRQYAPGQPALIAAFRLDFRLWRVLKRTVDAYAPDPDKRRTLRKAAFSYFRYTTGWPFSAKLIMRYTYVILPDWFVPKMLAWLERHPGADAALRRVIGIGKAPAPDESGTVSV